MLRRWCYVFWIFHSSEWWLSNSHQSSDLTRDCHKAVLQKKVLSSFWDPALHLLTTPSDRMDDSEWGQLVTQNEYSSDVFENALYMTHTRRERESACFEKKDCWCSLAFLINFILTLHPHCTPQLPKLFSKWNTGRDTPHHMAAEKAARWHSL